MVVWIVVASGHRLSDKITEKCVILSHEIFSNFHEPLPQVAAMASYVGGDGGDMLSDT